MRTNFSPTAQAARLLAARAATPARSAPAGSSAGTATWNSAEELWCEWPRRSQSLAPFRSIRQALLQIQARHA